MLCVDAVLVIGIENTMKNFKCRYTFVAFTTFQLVSAAYYAFQLKSNDANTNVTLIWENVGAGNCNISLFKQYFDHVYEGYVSDKEYVSGIKRQLARAYYHGRLFRWSPIGKIYQKSNLYKHEKLIIFSDQHALSRQMVYAIRKARDSHVIMAEEGAANYCIQNNKWLFRFGKKHFPLPLIIFPLLGLDTVANHGTSGLYDALAVRFPEKVPDYKAHGFKMLRQKAFWDDTDFVESFRKIIKDNIDLADDKNIILWIGCPGDGIYEQGLQYELVSRIADRLPDGYMMYIKAHPREKIDNYEVCFSEKVRPLVLHGMECLPLELLLRFLNPVLGLSLFSSAGLNMKDMGYRHRFVYGLLGSSDDTFLDWVRQCENMEGFEKSKDAVFDIDEILNLLQSDECGTNQMNEIKPIDDMADDIKYLLNLE